jgi:hypothetical protein
MTKPKVYFKDNAACLIFNNGSPSIEDLKQITDTIDSLIKDGWDPLSPQLTKGTYFQIFTKHGQKVEVINKVRTDMYEN